MGSPATRSEHARVRGLEALFMSVDEFFMELLAGAQPGVFELNVDIRSQTPQADHLFARSSMRMRSPMSSMKTSSPVLRLAASTMSAAASSGCMKYRVMSECVIVTGPPSSIWRSNVGTTLPRSRARCRTAQRSSEPSTPRSQCSVIARTVHKDLSHPLGGAHDRRRIHRFVGRHEDEMTGTVLRRRVSHHPGTPDVVHAASCGYISMSGTCLYAATWKMTSGRSVRTRSSIRS